MKGGTIVDATIISSPMTTASMANEEKQTEIRCAGDSIGLVFPVYNHLIPYIVKRFVEKVDSLEGKYIFAVCTPCIALEYLAKLICAKGGGLCDQNAV